MGGHVQRPWTPTKRRGPIGAEFQSPGPAAVILPGLIGSKSYLAKVAGPSYTFGGKHNDKNYTAGPGPGVYNIAGLSSKGKDSPPVSTLHIRPKDPKAFQTPAPSAYNPDHGDKVVLDTSPSYTFGVKTLPVKGDNNPAPNTYNIPPVLGQCMEGSKKAAPAYSMPGRGKDILGGGSASPGPGTYELARPDITKQRSPAFSLSVRTQTPSDDTMKPGPGAHSPEKVRLDNPPSHTFGIKHSPYTGALKYEFW